MGWLRRGGPHDAQGDNPRNTRISADCELHEISPPILYILQA
jgi:hypothetical protein